MDKDWVRFRSSFFYASGDPSNRSDALGMAAAVHCAHGFDTIVDETNFAGGAFSFFDQQGIRLTSTGIALTNPGSLLVSLRSNKEEGQANFVNPGSLCIQRGRRFQCDAQAARVRQCKLPSVRPHRAVANSSWHKLGIRHSIGTDTGIGLQYRPPLTENIVITSGSIQLSSGRGFRGHLQQASVSLRIHNHTADVLNLSYAAFFWATMFATSLAGGAGPGNDSAAGRAVALLICAALSASVAGRRPAEHTPKLARHSRDPRLGDSIEEAAEVGWLRKLPQPDGQRDHAHDRNCAPGLHRLSWRKCADRATRWRCAGIAAIPGADRGKRIRRPGLRRTPEPPPIPCARIRKWLKEDADYIKFVNPGDLRVAEQTCGRSGCHTCGGPARAHQHDDARRDAVGGGALQQWRVSAEESVLWRELRSRWNAAEPADFSAADSGRDAH